MLLYGFALFLFQGLDEEEVLIVPLHQVFFPCQLFYRRSIELQVVREIAVFFNTFCKIFLAFPDPGKITSSSHLRKHVITVKKQHPDDKTGKSQKIFIAKKRSDLSKKFH